MGASHQDLVLRPVGVDTGDIQKIMTFGQKSTHGHFKEVNSPQLRVITRQ
jgi:hypothetical protein